MSHPDLHGPPDRTPIQIGEVWENPITGERAKILELPYRNPERRAVAELLARAGARGCRRASPSSVGRTLHREGELTVKRGGQTSILHQRETATIEPDVWHDWWNASERDARVRWK
jgi:quercetin dioxygenase-like cupin family protein